MKMPGFERKLLLFFKSLYNLGIFKDGGKTNENKFQKIWNVSCPVAAFNAYPRAGSGIF